MARKPKKPIEVKTLTHGEMVRTNIPTAEFQSKLTKRIGDVAAVRSRATA